MTHGTYTSSYASSIEPTANPATFTSTARVNETRPVYAGTTYSAVVSVIGGTIFNAGTLTAAYGFGVYFTAGGSLINQTGGYVGGRLDGVLLIQPSGTASVVNAAGATIHSGQDYGVAATTSPAVIANAGAILGPRGGVSLANGGSITNTGTQALVQGAFGILVQGQSGTLNNSGTVSAASGGAFGVSLAAGGLVENLGATALIRAKYGAAYNDNAIAVGGQPGTVINSGSIYGNGQGIYLGDGGTVTNAAGGALTGMHYGIHVAIAAGTVMNSGVISGPGLSGTLFHSPGYGIALKAGGSVTNAAGGTISGKNAGVLLQGSGTVTNYGTIAGSFGYDSVVLASPTDELAIGVSGRLLGPAFGAGGTLALLATLAAHATVSGLGSGTLSGPISGTFNSFSSYLVPAGNGLYLAGQNTIGATSTLLNNGGLYLLYSALTNHGTIIDTGTVVAGTLVNTGVVNVSNGSFGVATLTGPGTIDIASGGHVQLYGTASGGIDFLGPGTFAAVSSLATGIHVSNFTAGDTIDLFDVPFNAANTVTYSSTSHNIILYNSSHTLLAGLSAFNVTIAPGMMLAQTSAKYGTNIFEQVACFAVGTRIATERGEVPVEMLRIGDHVHIARNYPSPFSLADGEGRGWVRDEVIWIGHRHIDCTRHPSPHKVWPVRISAGAFGNGLPHRDLYLSPDHAVAFNGVLIPIRHLINGTTIMQLRVDAIHYFHVELPQHDILIAEGLPAESYLDTGNRAGFANGGAHIDLHPDFATRTREASGCLPLIVTGPKLAEARRQLATARWPAPPAATARPASAARSAA